LELQQAPSAKCDDLPLRRGQINRQNSPKSSFLRQNLP
jgi:hypothetical protein